MYTYTRNYERKRCLVWLQIDNNNINLDKATSLEIKAHIKVAVPRYEYGLLQDDTILVDYNLIVKYVDRNESTAINIAVDTYEDLKEDFVINETVADEEGNPEQIERINLAKLEEASKIKEIKLMNKISKAISTQGHNVIINTYKTEE